MKLKIKRRIFNDAYYPYLKDYKHRYEVFYGGAGSGKSVFIAQKLIIKALERKRTVLIVRKTAASQKKSCWKLIKNTLAQFHILSECKVNKSDYEIELPNGSVFYFVGIDNSERLKSIVGITEIWIEEANECEEDDFSQLDLRLRGTAKDKQIYLSFNPVSKANWVYKHWFLTEPDEDTLIVKTTYKDNKFLDQEYIKSLQKMINTNPTYYRIYALGEFCTLDRLVYNNWKIEEFNYQDIKGSLLVGLDFGFSVDTTAIVASILQEDKLYVFREYGDTGLTNDKIANVIKTLGFNKSVIVADSAEPKSIEEIRKQGISKIIPSVKGPDSIIHGVNQLQQLQIIVHPSCVNTITEFENYTWQKKDGEYINKPVDQFNHYLDALRYSLQCVGKRLQTIKKIQLGV